MVKSRKRIFRRENVIEMSTIVVTALVSLAGRNIL
jgi:hypothetical protein